MFVAVEVMEFDAVAALALCVSDTGCSMLCKRPYMYKGVLAAGCGQCLPCRINRRRKWTYRMLFEAMKHDHSAFITLTYENAPEFYGVQTLDPEHTKRFIDRLRKRLKRDTSLPHYFPKKIRYFLVGEYGDESDRPHYHLALFGYPP